MTDIHTEMLELIELAKQLGPEDEGINISDREYTQEQMAGIRSLLGTTRKAIDLVSAALAVEWDEAHNGEYFNDGANIWSVGRTKGKKVVDLPAFYAWLATKDADELAKLMPAREVKVTGMTPAERSTFLDESPTSDKLTLKSKPRGY